MKLRFLGTNGWYATNLGNTICILLETEKFYIVFDAGDGIYKLDRYINSQKPIYLFLSHFHLDHTYGFHIFDKFTFKNPLTIFGQPGTKRALKKIICHPYSKPFKDLKIKVSFHELKEGKYNKPKTPFSLECRYLPHGDPCFGYRLSLDGKTITYCTDTGVCENMLKLSQNADILITECSLKEADPNSKWAHLDPKKAARVAKKVKAKRLFLVHFEARTYTTLKDRKRAEKIAQKIFPQTTVAFDDMEINLNKN